jgi:hypothetical protein
MTRTSRTGMLFLMLALAGCRQVPMQPAEETAPLAPAAKVDALAPLPAPDPALVRLPLSDRLALEADARPVSAVRPEQLERALRERGVLFVRKRQVLASTVGAAYCELAVSSEGLGVSICEFPDAATAARGSAQSHRLFDARIPGRTLATHHGSLLTLTEPQDARAADQAALILAVFNALSPAPLQTKTALAR